MLEIVGFHPWMFVPPLELATPDPISLQGLLRPRPTTLYRQHCTFVWDLYLHLYGVHRLYLHQERSARRCLNKDFTVSSPAFHEVAPKLQEGPSCLSLLLSAPMSLAGPPFPTQVEHALVPRGPA